MNFLIILVLQVSKINFYTKKKHTGNWFTCGMIFFLVIFNLLLFQFCRENPPRARQIYHRMRQIRRAGLLIELHGQKLFEAPHHFSHHPCLVDQKRCRDVIHLYKMVERKYFRNPSLSLRYPPNKLVMVVIYHEYC